MSDAEFSPCSVDGCLRLLDSLESEDGDMSWEWAETLAALMTGTQLGWVKYFRVWRCTDCPEPHPALRHRLSATGRRALEAWRRRSAQAS